MKRNLSFAGLILLTSLSPLFAVGVDGGGLMAESSLNDGETRLSWGLKVELQERQFKLFDGRVLPLSQIRSFHWYGKEIDYLELTDGEIVDRSDIRSLDTFQDRESLKSFFMAKGVDGGG